MDNKNIKSEIIIYNSDDGKCKVDVRLEEDTVWLTQEQMSDLFQKAKSTINEHIQNIYADGELEIDNTMKKFGNSEFSKKPTNMRIQKQGKFLLRVWRRKTCKRHRQLIKVPDPGIVTFCAIFGENVIRFLHYC